MTTMKEHFDLVNNSTLFGNFNRGQVLDPNRYSSQQKILPQFQNGKKISYNYNNSNFKPDGDIKDMGNFVSGQLQEMGYRYGS